jgi:hypothetical protein
MTRRSPALPQRPAGAAAREQESNGGAQGGRLVAIDALPSDVHTRDDEDVAPTAASTGRVEPPEGSRPRTLATNVPLSLATY